MSLAERKRSTDMFCRSAAFPCPSGTSEESQKAEVKTQKSRVGTGLRERLSRRGREICMGKHARKDVAQGSLFSLAAFPPRRGSSCLANGKFSGRIDRGAAHENSNYLVAARNETAPSKKDAAPESGHCATCFPELPSS